MEMGGQLPAPASLPPTIEPNPELVWTRCRTFYLLYPTIENGSVIRPARGLFTVPTELPRLHSFVMNLVIV